MLESAEITHLRRQMAMLEKSQSETERAMAHIREQIFKATCEQELAQTTIANLVKSPHHADGETRDANVMLQEMAGSQCDTQAEERAFSETAEVERTSQLVAAHSPVSQYTRGLKSVKAPKNAQKLFSSSPQSSQKQPPVDASPIETVEADKVSANYNLPTTLRRSDAHPLSTSVTPPTPHNANEPEPFYLQLASAPQGHYPTPTQNVTSFNQVCSLPYPCQDRSRVIPITQARLVSESSLWDQSIQHDPSQRTPSQVRNRAINPGVLSTQHALFASQYEAQRRDQFERQQDAASQQVNSRRQPTPQATRVQQTPHATSPQPQRQFDSSPVYRFRGGLPRTGQYNLDYSYQQRGLSKFVPANSPRTSSSSFDALRPSGVGKSRLKKKLINANQRQNPAQQFGDPDEIPEKPSHKSGTSQLVPLPLQRKRSPSIIITNEGPAKKQHQKEDIRIMTPPLNEDESPIQSFRHPNRRNGPLQKHQQTTSSRQLASNQGTPSRESSTQEEIDVYKAAPLSSRRHVKRHDQGRSPQLIQPDQSARNRLLLPQVSPQPYALHMQQRVTQSGSESPPSRTTNLPSHHHQTRSGTQPVTTKGAIIYPPSNSYQPYRPYRSPSRPRSKRRAATAISPGTYEIPLYRRLTPNERSELELRYCAHLARYLCSNTCVTSPPYPLSTENLWTRMSRRFPPEPGRALPPDFNPNEVYHTAADFEADVKAMLKQYILMGHCGEQPVRDPSGREVEVRCEFEKTGNARVMCWRMRLESVLDEKLRELRMRLRECEEGYVAEDMEGKRGCIDGAFLDARLGE